MDNLVEYLARELFLDDSKKSIVKFGFQSFYITSLNFLFILTLSLVLDLIPEAIIIALSIIIFKKFSGGSHSNNLWICVTLGTFIVITLGFVVKNYKSYFFAFGWWQLLIPLFIFYVTYLYAPKDVPQKPITNKKQRDYLRRLSLLLATFLILFGVYTILTHVLQVYFMAIMLGFLWQSFTLTPAGFSFIKNVDKLFVR